MSSSTARSRVARGAALAALLLGAVSYLARPTDPAIVGWLDRVHLGPLAALARVARHAVYAHVHLPSWFRGSASDAAYAFALGALLADAPKGIVALGMAVVLGHEIAQGPGLAAGTFDPRDLVVLFLSFLVAQVIFRPALLSALRAKRISS